MNEKFSPLVSPDSARKVFQLLNRFYDGYTKRSYGRSDVDGLQYAGTADNFGSEIYFESRKMRMQKAPFELVFSHNDFNFYFNLMYSELIETYDQQTMIVATLKDNVLLSNKKYEIVFSNCRKEIVVRSESWSDPEVHKDVFIVTDTPPVLKITDIDDPSQVTNVTLKATCEEPVQYCFHQNITNERLYVYDESTNVLTVKEIANDTLTYREVNVPLVWLKSSIFNTLPDIGFVDNIDQNGNNLLTVGTDGHSVSRLYPFIYEDNVPAHQEDNLHWFIKVKPTDTTEFKEGYHVLNESAVANEIIYHRAISPWDAPTASQTITYDHSGVEIFLNDTEEWSYHKPVETDYDYDRTTYVNRTYAYICIDSFVDTIHPLFLIKFNTRRLVPFDTLLGNSVTGAHIETCSDYSDNGTLKKNGFIHSLGDFDGLPRYFKTFEDNTQHRSHVELYAIRDYLNKLNQRTMEKQTAALVVDSALPHKDSEEYKNNMDVLIKYNFETDNGDFYTEESGMSMKDVKSAMVYVEDQLFAEEHLPGYHSLPHFIYHGDGVFSLSMSSLDPELEYARVFVISNDPCKYENNAKSTNPKPARTFARICDIPTNFSQLVHVPGIAPTVVADEKYIHSDASLSEAEKEMIMNTLRSKWASSPHNINDVRTKLGVFGDMQDLDDLINMNPSGPYTKRINLNPTVDYSTMTLTISQAGDGYDINDQFTFYLGGLLVTGTVTDVASGEVVSATLDLGDDEAINIANLDGRSTTYTPETTVGSGEGLKITLTVDETTWNMVNNHLSTDTLPGLFTFKFDKYGFLWVWEYDRNSEMWVKTSQFNGPTIIDNTYDYTEDIDKRSTGDVMLYNWLVYRKPLYLTSVAQYVEQSSIPVTTPIDTITSFDNDNYPSTCYLLDNYDISDNINYYRMTYYTDARSSDLKSYMLFPRYNRINISKFRNKGVTLEVVDNSLQPLLCYFNPNKNTVTTWDRVTSTTYDSSDKPMTVLDVIRDNFVTTTGHLKAPLFKYNEFSISDGLIQVMNQVHIMSRGALITFIQNTYPDAILLQYEDTENAYTADMLRDYIISNYYDNPVYFKNETRILREMNEKVVIFDDDEVIPVGEQPTGGYEYFVEKHNKNVIMDDTKYMTEITNIFKLDQTIDLTGFRIIDDENNDLSRNSLIIMNREKYVFVDEWIKLN